MDVVGRCCCGPRLDVLLSLVHGIQNDSCQVEKTSSELLFLVCIYHGVESAMIV